MSLSRIQIALAVVVSLAWLATFFIDVPGEARAGAQVAFMLVLGRIFGIGITRGGNGNGS